MASVDSNRGAKRAREARARLGLDPVAPLPCVLSVVEQRVGAPVVVANLPDTVAGACYRNGAGAVLWVNGAQATPRQRFTLAHELGHLWCGHDGRLEVDSFATLNGKTSNPLEIQANAFAAEFLVPRAAMAEVVTRPAGLEELVVIAAHYGVSAIVVLFRLVTAGLIDAERETRLRAEIDEDLHLVVRRHVDVPDRADRLAAIDQLPYFSPALAGSALAAALAGSAPVASAAHAAGVAPEDLGVALETIS